MIALDGRGLRRDASLRCDVVVVGSGPAGAAVARRLARAGVDVVVVEEGHPAGPVGGDAFTAMSTLYRGLGATLAWGRAPFPVVQGRAVGGTSVINGAISWRLPRDVYDAWVAADPGLADDLPWERIDAETLRVEADLEIAPTDPSVAGRNNVLFARGAEALGLGHRPIARNVRGCEGLGRCLQGCPKGHKLSMDRSYLPDAVAAGARIASGVRVTRLDPDGVVGAAAGGGRLTVRATDVVLAASAVHSPALLLASRIRHGPVGRRFMCHPGVSMAGRFADPVRLWTGATQGHEVTSLRSEGIKLEALGYDVTVAALRLKRLGRALTAGIADLPHVAAFGAAIRAQALGTVGRGGVVRYQPTAADVRIVRRSVRILGEMMLAAGAEYVEPGVHGWHDRVADRAVMARFEDEGPTHAGAYALVATHLFGTCRMGTDPAANVVRPDFRHHARPRLWVADSSVFPSNTGVNPQTSILVLAGLCAENLLASRGG